VRVFGIGDSRRWVRERDRSSVCEEERHRRAGGGAPAWLRSVVLERAVSGVLVLDLVCSRILRPLSTFNETVIFRHIIRLV